MDLLQKHNWTGNIRELRNVVERLIILSGKTITPRCGKLCACRKNKLQCKFLQIIPNMKHIYCISGFGADERVFSKFFV